MKSTLLTAALALALPIAGGLVAMPTASAQPAGALGHPLPAAELAPGTIVVRVIAGSVQTPAAGIDVTLTVNGTPRIARTDAGGRANFPGLPVGATVQAKVAADGGDATSDSFDVPDAGGMRVMLSTKPFQPGAGGAPFAGGAGGDAPFAGGGAMPEPRQISGQPRGERGDPPGSITVLVTYDNLHDPNPATGVPVTLVGYASDDSIKLVTVPTGADGRAKFDGLDVTGGTAYYAMAQLPRNHSIDRLYSQPVVLGSEIGVRMALSGDKRDATTPAVDDLGSLERDPSEVPAGKVRVLVDGTPGFKNDIILIDASTLAPVGHAVSVIDPDNAEIKASAQVEDNPGAAAGTLAIEVGNDQTNEPLAGIAVSLAPTDGKIPAVSATTDTNGTATITATPSKTMQAVFTIRGRELLSRPFDISKHGAKLIVRAHWDGGRPESMIDFVGKPGQVVLAQTTVKGTTYRSLPFQPVADRGTTVTLYVFPRNLMTFQLFAGIEDQLLAVQGKIKIENFSWAPYLASADGLEIPLPKGFKGAIVANQNQDVAAVDQAIGYRIIRPLPPMGVAFECGFSLPVDHGAVDWQLDMPWGAYGSLLQIVEFPGMQVVLPPGVKGQHADAPNGMHFFVVPQISIAQGKQMRLQITGLPSAPEWKSWAPRVVGIVALVIMVIGVAIGIRHNPALAFAAKGMARGVIPTPSQAKRARDQRREKLMDELVALEHNDQAGNAKRREQVLAELEELWEQS